MLTDIERLRELLDALEGRLRNEHGMPDRHALELRVRVYDVASSVVIDEVVVSTTGQQLGARR